MFYKIKKTDIITYKEDKTIEIKVNFLNKSIREKLYINKDKQFDLTRLVLGKRQVSPIIIYLIKKNTEETIDNVAACFNLKPFLFDTYSFKLMPSRFHVNDEDYKGLIIQLE
jgi:hypothetical protein